MNAQYRTEEDSLGPVKLPIEAYYGAQTQRALENFPISGRVFPPSFIQALGLIKKCAAIINRELGLLNEKVAQAIVEAADEVMDGKHQEQFPLDIFQTGSGTSTNMNMNEVIAGRANEIINGVRGGKKPVHPNDHVNLGQSSNDVIPSAIHIAALASIKNDLQPALAELRDRLSEKAATFAQVKKMGRTHLQDAVPLTLGQEFSGYARQVELARRRLANTEESLIELALGGTAVGTGLNAHPEFAGRVIELLASESGYDFREAENHFEAQAAQDSAVETSGALKTLAVGLIKIANDIRWMGSGPRCGLVELLIPSLQPGSSIMPGKVNPVLPEAVIQVAAQVIGNDAAITMGGQLGYFELNTMLPVIAHNLLESIHILSTVCNLFAEKCISGLDYNPKACAMNLENSLSLATHLAPAIGYDRAAAVAKEAHKTGKTIRQVVVESGLLTDEKVDELYGFKK